MKHASDHGFTLLETLITLLIVSMLFAFPVLSIQQMLEKIEVELFFRELSANITMMQNHAILTGERTQVIILPTQQTIRFRLGANMNTRREIVEIDLPEDVTRFNGTRQSVYSFARYSGNVHNSNEASWTTTFNTVKGDYELVFMIGSGRHEIRKK